MFNILLKFTRSVEDNLLVASGYGNVVRRPGQGVRGDRVHQNLALKFSGISGRFFKK
jgi:hypothetical protein